MLRIGIIMLFSSALLGCALPSLEGRQVSQALTTYDGQDTRLGRSMAPLLERNQGLSGVATLEDSMDAFAARMLLIASAQRSLDLQYYIWRDDITGNLLLHALHEAAKRNVRVRLLIDDNGTSGLDAKLAALHALPGVEVRLFNPFPFRTFKQLGFITDFSRLNRRMHNKSLTVDGQLTIVGGRNIGDEYFGATQGVVFADLDVLAAGTVVDEVARDFDRYWNSDSAYPADLLIRTPKAQTTQRLLQTEASTVDLPSAQAYVQAVANSRFIEKLLQGELNFHWVPVRMVSDDPAKVLGEAREIDYLTSRLQAVLDTPLESVDLVSPYFVPTSEGVDVFAKLVGDGVRVRVLTNSLAATDVLAVHAGYAKYRVPLLQSGVALYELRADGNRKRPKEKAGPFGSSGSSLHAKTFAVDGQRVFVGSFNFDPRSARLNTELGFVIESALMAQTISAAFDQGLREYAYELELADHNRLVWLAVDDMGSHRYDSEPGLSIWKRLYLGFLSLLPIEPLL